MVAAGFESRIFALTVSTTLAPLTRTLPLPHDTYAYAAVIVTLISSVEFERFPLYYRQQAAEELRSVRQCVCRHRNKLLSVDSRAGTVRIFGMAIPVTNLPVYRQTV